MSRIKLGPHSPSTRVLLATPEAAVFLGVSPEFLEHDRLGQRLIPFIRIASRLIRYDVRDLERVITANRIGGDPPCRKP